MARGSGHVLHRAFEPLPWFHKLHKDRCHVCQNNYLTKMAESFCPKFCQDHSLLQDVSKIHGESLNI